MNKIKPIKARLRRTDEVGIFHNSREDVARIAKFVNEIADKQEEIIEAMNKLIEAKRTEADK